MQIIKLLHKTFFKSRGQGNTIKSNLMEDMTVTISYIRFMKLVSFFNGHYCNIKVMTKSVPCRFFKENVSQEDLRVETIPLLKLFA